jgi:hypothetical protein
LTGEYASSGRVDVDPVGHITAFDGVAYSVVGGEYGLTITPFTAVHTTAFVQDMVGGCVLQEHIILKWNQYLIYFDPKSVVAAPAASTIIFVVI